MHLNQKGFAPLLLVITTLLLLAGIGIGIYLIQNPAIFKPKASEIQQAEIQKTPSNSKYGSTPISELNNYPKPVNHIQIAGNLDFGSYPSVHLFKRFIATEYDYFFYNPGAWMGKSEFPTSMDDYNEIWQIIAEIKGMNPKSKQGLYIGGVLSPDSYYWPYLFLKNRDDLVLHRKNGQVVEKIPNWKDAASGAEGYRYLRLINLFNPNTTEEIGNFWKNIYQTKKVDGLLIDGFDPLVNADWTRRPAGFSDSEKGLGLAEGCKEGPCSSDAYWTSNMPAFTSRLSQISESVGADVFSNGLFWYGYNPNDAWSQFRGPVAQNFANYNTGVLSEWIVEAYVYPDRFKDYMEAIQNITNKNKKVFFYAIPQVLKYITPSPYTDAKNNLDMERFFLGSYLLIQKNPLTFFGYHPGQPYSAYFNTSYPTDNKTFPEMFFYKDWNLDYGNPQTPYAIAPNGLYYRGYDNGVIYVNPTDQPITNDLAPQQTYLIWDPCYGTQVKDRMTFPPKSGYFLFYQTKGCNYNITPSFNLSEMNGTTKEINRGTHNFTWTPQPGAFKYTVKIDDHANDFNQGCDGNNKEGDRCETFWTSNIYTYTFIEGHKYTVQVFQHDASGAQIGQPIGVYVNTGATNPSPVFNVSTEGSTNIPEGNQTFTWNKKDGAAKFTLKIDDQANAFHQHCDGNNLLGDICDNTLTSNFYSFDFVKDHNYTVQVFQHDGSGSQLGEPSSIFVTIGTTSTPTPTPSPSSTCPIPTAPVCPAGWELRNIGTAACPVYSCATPSPSPSASPSPLNSSSPSLVKKGDADKDGDVDVFDYGILLNNYDESSANHPQLEFCQTTNTLCDTTKIDWYDYGRWIPEYRKEN